MNMNGAFRTSLVWLALFLFFLPLYSDVSHAWQQDQKVENVEDAMSEKQKALMETATNNPLIPASAISAIKRKAVNDSYIEKFDKAQPVGGDTAEFQQWAKDKAVWEKEKAALEKELFENARKNPAEPDRSQIVKEYIEKIKSFFRFGKKAPVPAQSASPSGAPAAQKKEGGSGFIEWVGPDGKLQRKEI